MPPTIFEATNQTTNAPTDRCHRWLWPLAAFVVLCFLLFFFRLGDRDLASSHEARAGQDAQTMLNSGQWDLPRLFDGRVEMQKPPLYYWLVAVLGALNGGEVDAVCVRLPAALAALGCVLLLLTWGARRGRPLAGYLAAVMLATCLHFTALARIGRIDMPLTLTVSLTLVGFVEGKAQRQRDGGRAGWHWFLLAYLAVAAGILLKGPIAVALPLVVGVAWWTMQHFPGRQRLDTPSTIRRPPSATLGLAWGVPLVLALTLPWYLWANHQTDGEFFRVFFWHHNIDRGFGTDDLLRAYPWWYYGPQALLDLLPWSLVLPFAAWSAWRHRDRDASFGAAWFLAMLLLLSSMRFKRADYLVPAFPGFAWMMGCVGERWYRTACSRRLSTAFAAVVAVTAAVWCGYLTLVVPALEEARTHRRFAEEVRRLTSKRVLFFWTEAHLLAFHVGQPLTTFVEWDRLDAWAGLPQTTYIVMPLECLRESPKYLTQGTLEAVAFSAQMSAARNHPSAVSHFGAKLGLELHERPYVLVRTRSLSQPLETAAVNR